VILFEEIELIPLTWRYSSTFDFGLTPNSLATTMALVNAISNSLGI
jgi:hypothetical protein